MLYIKIRKKALRTALIVLGIFEGPTSTNCHDLVKNLSKVSSGKILAKTLERIMHCFGTHS